MILCWSHENVLSRVHLDSMRPSSVSMPLIGNYAEAPLGTLSYPITSQVSVQCCEHPGEQHSKR